MVENSIIETRNLTKIYGDGEQVHALDGVDLAIRRGEMAAIMGPSGSGKSTLLNMLGGLDRPSSGQVLIDGQDLAAVRSLDAFRARTVGFVFQLHNLLPTLTALENVEAPMRGQPLGRRERRERARELLTLVGLPDRMDHLPSQLSGGQRQKVAIARALANRPRLILADEPTGNLDTQSGAEIMALLRRLNQELGTTVIIVTHDSAVAHHTGRILVMRDGRIVYEHAVGTAFEEDLDIPRFGFGSGAVGRRRRHPVPAQRRRAGRGDRVSLALFETWLQWAGAAALAGFLVTVFVLRRPRGRATGLGNRALRWPVYLLIGVPFFGLAYLLWRPLPVALSPALHALALSLGALLYFPGLGLALWGRCTTCPCPWACSSTPATG